MQLQSHDNHRDLCVCFTLSSLWNPTKMSIALDRDSDNCFRFCVQWLVSQSCQFTPHVPLTETPGPANQNQWIRRQIALRGQGSGNIIFRGRVGNSFSGDIALDDISVSQGTCTGEVSLLSPAR